MIDEIEPPHSHHGWSGIKWLDALALSVVALSVASLLTAQHTGKTMERLVSENSRLVRAQSTPLLLLRSGNITGPGQRQDHHHRVERVGTGTARVIELARGKPVRTARELID
jgi:hypothetical protein